MSLLMFGCEKTPEEEPMTLSEFVIGHWTRTYGVENTMIHEIIELRTDGTYTIISQGIEEPDLVNGTYICEDTQIGLNTNSLNVYDVQWNPDEKNTMTWIPLGTQDMFIWERIID